VWCFEGAVSSSAYRTDLLRAAADGFDEALKLDAARVTESAHVGLAQVRQGTRLGLYM